MYLLLPLIAAIAFALGAMVFKRAYQEGAGVAHALVVNNVILGVLFTPLMFLDSRPVPWSLCYMPALTALAFVTGHLLNVLSLKAGDVSLSTPLLGSKAVFVVLISWLAFGTRLTPAQWVSAGLTTLGVLAMGATDLKAGRKAGQTTALALGCSGAFALTDVLIQTWGSSMGVWNFLSLQFAALALLSCAALPFFGREALRAPKAAWNWIFLGASLSAVQALLITGTIAFWKDAAGVNVIYATRGLWSLALVWVLGDQMKNDERQSAGRRILFWRAVGAILLLAAVALAAKTASRHPE